MKIGALIRNYRLDRKLKQEDLAQELNITQRAYSKIENDEVQIKLDRLIQIAEILNIEPRMLIPELRSGSFMPLPIPNGPISKENELYEKIICRQQNEIEYLKGIIDIFKS